MIIYIIYDKAILVNLFRINDFDINDEIIDDKFNSDDVIKQSEIDYYINKIKYLVE